MTLFSGFGKVGVLSGAGGGYQPSEWLFTGTDGPHSGTIDVSGASNIIVAGVGAGGAGGSAGPLPASLIAGAEGGAGGTSNLNAITIDVSALDTIFYHVKRGQIIAAVDNTTQYGGNTEIRSTNAGGTILYALNGGNRGNPANAYTVNAGHPSLPAAHHLYNGPGGTTNAGTGAVDGGDGGYGGTNTGSGSGTGGAGGAGASAHGNGGGGGGGDCGNWPAAQAHVHQRQGGRAGGQGR